MAIRDQEGDGHEARDLPSVWLQHIGSQVCRDQRASWVAAFAADNVLTGFHVNNPETFPMTSTNY
ncbi:MAG: hypothetical protein P8N76_08075 [Pirellulaceae bacterium]|nr:hypothetical protein [Pirellulaceae bacterium]